jgi:hypothetical protein
MYQVIKYEEWRIYLIFVHCYDSVNYESEISHYNLNLPFLSFQGMRTREENMSASIIIFMLVVSCQGQRGISLTFEYILVYCKSTF